MLLYVYFKYICLIGWYHFILLLELIPLLQPPFYSRDVGEMYDGILHKPLPLPPGKSEAVTSLLVGLLQKDQHRRLGAIADFVSGLYLKNSFRWFPTQEISLVLDKGCFSMDSSNKFGLVTPAGLGLF